MPRQRHPGRRPRHPARRPPRPAPGAGSSGLTEATAYLAEYTQNPTSIGLETPLRAKPDPGKKIIYLKTPGAVAERGDAANSAAAAALDWSYSTIDTGATPATAVSAFTAAIAQQPAAIIFAGYPAAVFTAQIQQAKTAGIAVISNATGDEPVDGVLADLGGTAQEELYGRLTAAHFVVNSHAQGQAALFNLNIFPILTDYSDAFQAAVQQWCPQCSVEVVNQQLADVGTKTPANVVSYLQRNPSTKCTVFGNGDLSQGVSAAIRTAGLSGVNIIGEVPTEANLAHLTSREEQAWAGYPVDILGWRMMDTLARHFEGSDLAAPVAIPLPMQLITTENVKTVVSDSGGYYTGVAGYQDQFTRLWNVS